MAGVIAFFILGLPAFFITALGVGHYLDDYCFTRDGMIPRGAIEDGSVEGPRFASPFSLECSNENGTVRRRDAAPVLFATAMLGGVLMCAAAAGMSATPARRSPSAAQSLAHLRSRKPVQRSRF
jgi:hypothetical protein